MSGARYAVYFAPRADDPLAAFGRRLLGYDAETGEETVQMAPQGFEAARWRSLTASPRFYGFHATLKAPFHLAPGVDEKDLSSAFEGFVARRRAFALPLRLAQLERFVALVPKSAPPALIALEEAVVSGFEPFRAQLSDADLERRLQAPLTPRQRHSLERFGYPYVGPDFRFHMTLTGALGDEEISRAIAGVSQLIEATVSDLTATIDALCLFRQESREAPFRLLTRVAMQSKPED